MSASLVLRTPEEVPLYELVPVFGPEGKALDAYRGVRDMSSGNVVSVVSDRYGLVGHRAIAEAVHQVGAALGRPDPDAFGARAAAFTPESITLYQGGRRMEVKLVVGQKFSLGEGETFFPGLRILNSLDGAWAVRVEAFAVRACCTNQLYAGARSFMDLEERAGNARVLSAELGPTGDDLLLGAAEDDLLSGGVPGRIEAAREGGHPPDDVLRGLQVSRKSLHDTFQARSRTSPIGGVGGREPRVQVGCGLAANPHHPPPQDLIHGPGRARVILQHDLVGRTELCRAGEKGKVKHALLAGLPTLQVGPSLWVPPGPGGGMDGLGVPTPRRGGRVS